MNDAVLQQLESVASSSNLPSDLENLAAQWATSAANLDTVEAILRFMENHPSLDFGMPGPLVHFVEKFYHAGYEQELMESVKRRPTAHTTWMVNRILNGTKSASEKQALIDLLKQAQTHPMIDTDVLRRIQRFLARIDSE